MKKIKHVTFLWIFVVFTDKLFIIFGPKFITMDFLEKGGQKTVTMCIQLRLFPGEFFCICPYIVCCWQVKWLLQRIHVYLVSWVTAFFCNNSNIPRIGFLRNCLRKQCKWRLNYRIPPPGYCLLGCFRNINHNTPPPPKKKNI